MKHRMQDFTNKNWYVDYKDEDGYDTYGPDTYEGCTKWIQTMNARVASGEKFDVDRGPYQKEAVKVKDGYKEEHAAEYAIDADKVMDLYEQGKITLSIPDDVNVHEFAKACISFIDDLWGEPEVNFQYEDTEFNYKVNESANTITIYSVD